LSWVQDLWGEVLRGFVPSFIAFGDDWAWMWAWCREGGGYDGGGSRHTQRCTRGTMMTNVVGPTSRGVFSTRLG
jgi:hypothetical protein